MQTFRQLTLVLALSAAFSSAAFAAEANRPVQVLAALPITYGLGQLLLDGSEVKLQRAAAANLPGSRQTAYFSGRGAPALHKLAVKADAVIGLRSVWADDPLYPMARRSNIRIVEVDAARPVDGSLPGIAVQPGALKDGLNSQPWLSSNNLGRMADVTAADLVRLAPAAKGRIEANLATLKQQLLKLSADSETRLGELDNLSVVSLSERFGYLMGGLNLEQVAYAVPADDQWTPEALQQLTTLLKDNEVALVLDHRQPGEAVAAAIGKAGSRLLVLEGGSDNPLSELQGSIDQVIKALAGKA